MQCSLLLYYHLYTIRVHKLQELVHSTIIAGNKVK